MNRKAKTQGCKEQLLTDGVIAENFRKKPQYIAFDSYLPPTWSQY